MKKQIEGEMQMGFFKSLAKAIIGGIHESDYPDRKSYLEALFDYTLKRRNEHEESLRRGGHPSLLDDIARRTRELEKIKDELSTLGIYKHIPN